MMIVDVWCYIHDLVLRFLALLCNVQCKAHPPQCANSCVASNKVTDHPPTDHLIDASLLHRAILLDLSHLQM